ncbi:MAG: hypothetical protein HQK91_06135 [Nitrospirae bacterium]|nr:hypothetical protein [Nitrospirota bacterium]MBF0541011.1 hypothetical protein [Nitrospirota bacterium]
MAKDLNNNFNEIITMASKFVESQKGSWDHYAWLGFLYELQKKGFDTNNDLQDLLGSVVESMNKCYLSVINTKDVNNIMRDMSQSTIEFMKKTKGVWDKTGWENYLNNLQNKGISLNEQTQIYAGNVLESVKNLLNVWYSYSNKGSN